MKLEPSLDHIAGALDEAFSKWVANITFLAGISLDENPVTKYHSILLRLTVCSFKELIQELPTELLEEVDQSSAKHVQDAIAYAPSWLYHYDLWLLITTIFLIFQEFCRR